ncbi:MAG TPA: hypothetical protein VJL28_11685 [Gemmatimonadaceae bacterium]|nr:hypothetical protein [Gemmatimonadaceae bacterium]
MRIGARLALFGLGNAALAVGIACSDRPAPRGDAPSAGVAGGSAAAFEHFESTAGKFAMEFPASWRGSYTASEKNDTTAGARFAVEFRFKPDPAWKVEPRTLLVLRIFPKPVWERIAARPGPPIAAKVAERGDDVFAVSFPSSNPYKPGTAAAARFDELVLAVMQPKEPLRFTPR